MTSLLPVWVPALVVLVLLFFAVLPAALPVAAQSQPSASGSCRPGYVPELFISGQAQITPGLPNRLRSAPSLNDRTGVPIGLIPGGGVVTVLEGPVCADNLGWWKINYEGQIGWTADGDGRSRWMDRMLGSMGTYEASGCPTNLPGRLTLGQPARVTFGPANALRDKPGKTGSNVVGELPGGAVFDVIGGPYCADGYRWWGVRSESGFIGWTAEGEGRTYWLEPVVMGRGEVSANCPALLYDDIRAGVGGTINNSAPAAVMLYGQPDETSQVYLSLGRGAQFTVAAGPVCGRGVRWWQIQDRATRITGWVMEGSAGQGWLNPNPGEFGTYEFIGCPANLPGRLTVGATARVTPGDPNTLRDTPGVRNARDITLIPGGERVRVVGGPFCVDNRRYWAVDYLGLLGWTAEGEGLTYWLEP